MEEIHFFSKWLKIEKDGFAVVMEGVVVSLVVVMAALASCLGARFGLASVEGGFVRISFNPCSESGIVAMVQI